MIFVTVGSQLGFDRLVHAVDAWAREGGRDDVFAQLGDTHAPPSHVAFERDLAPADFDARVEGARLVIGHAGTGTIMAALSRGKPVVVLARRAGRGETRNDHQVATLERFRGFSGFHGTTDESELPELLARALAASSGPGDAPAIGRVATGPLVERLRSFLDGALS